MNALSGFQGKKGNHFRLSLSGFLLVLIVLLPLASCAPPVQDGGGNVRIVLGGGARAVVSEGARNSFIYILDFSGPGGEQLRVTTSEGQESVTLTLTPGEWTVHVDAVLEANEPPFGSGDARFTAYAGRGNTVPIHMEPAFGNGFSSNIDAEDFGLGVLAADKMFRVDSAEKWGQALGEIRIGGPYKNYVITLTGDFSVGGLSYGEWSFGSAEHIKVSLRGMHTISLDPGGATGNLLRVGSDQTLILRDLTLKGHDDNDDSLVYISGSSSSPASLSMKAGAKITGNTATIGGGVFADYSSFTMYDGEISGNSATDNGGGVYVQNGSFTMNGGKISGNTSGTSGGGVSVGGNGSVDKTGGVIFGNTGDDGNANVAKNGTLSPADTYGHAVYYTIFIVFDTSYVYYYRDTTLDNTIAGNISTDTLPTDPGVGNAVGNWIKK
jgi:predicted outer membrane repeat protein